MMKNALRTLLFSLFAVITLNVTASQPFFKQDTLSFINRFIIEENGNYAGYRLYVSNITKIKEKRGKAYFTFSLTNTGKKEVKLEKGIKSPLLVLRPERKFLKSASRIYKQSLLNAILQDVDLSIDVAERKNKIEITVPVISISPETDEEPAEMTVTPAVNEKAATTTAKKKEDIKNKTILIAEKEKETGDMTKPAIEKNGSTGNVRTADVPGATKITKTETTEELEEVATTNPPVTDRTNDDTAIKTKPTEVVVEKVANGAVSSSTVPEKINKATDTTPPQTEKAQENVAEKPVPASEEIAEEEMGFQDLTFENIKVLKRKKKWVLVEFTIKNIGTQTVNLIGDPKIEEDNLAIRTYFSGVPKLSRGAIITGGMFFDEDRKHPESAFLKPGQTITKTIKVSTKMRTRYLKVLIFAIDPFNAIDEANRKNNTTYLILN